MIVDDTILNTVTTYVESVGRRRSIKHWNELDSLEVIMTGPTALMESWIPKIGQSHPDYPSMGFDGAETVNEAAGITEIRCTYVGKYYDNLQVTQSMGVQWGESSYVQYASYNVYTTPGDIADDGTQSPPTFTYDFISYSWACRYQISIVTYKTLSKGNIGVIGSGGGSLLSRFDYRTARQSQNNGMGLVNSVLSFPVVLLDTSATALNNGWYEISSTYGPHPVIDTRVFDIAVVQVVSVLE